MSVWTSVPLGSILKPGRGISYGIVQPGSAQDRGGVPIVRVADVRNGRISTQAPLCVDPAIEAAYARTRLEGGELLLTLVGTVGEAAVVPPELAGWNVARAVAVIPVREDIGASQASGGARCSRRNDLALQGERQRRDDRTRNGASIAAVSAAVVRARLGAWSGNRR